MNTKDTVEQIKTLVFNYVSIIFETKIEDINVTVGMELDDNYNENWKVSVHEFYGKKRHFKGSSKEEALEKCLKRYEELNKLSEKEVFDKWLKIIVENDTTIICAMLHNPTLTPSEWQSKNGVKSRPLYEVTGWLKMHKSIIEKYKSELLSRIEPFDAYNYVLHSVQNYCYSRIDNVCQIERVIQKEHKAARRLERLLDRYRIS
jgi:hypothetical protein